MEASGRGRKRPYRLYSLLFVSTTTTTKTTKTSYFRLDKPPSTPQPSPSWTPPGALQHASPGRGVPVSRPKRCKPPVSCGVLSLCVFVVLNSRENCAQFVHVILNSDLANGLDYPLLASFRSFQERKWSGSQDLCMNSIHLSCKRIGSCNSSGSNCSIWSLMSFCCSSVNILTTNSLGAMAAMPFEPSR